MRTSVSILVLAFLVTISCQAISASGTPVEQATLPGESTSAPLGTPAKPPSGAELFIDTGDTGDGPPAPGATRSRVVKLNLPLLLNASGQPRRLPAGQEIVLNLFPDVIYTAVIQDVEVQGDGGTWVGVLKDVEYSSVMMVYTSGVFLGHFASPAGVYEASGIGDDLYRIDLINQGALPGLD